MTKAEFVDKLAEKGKITKKLATEATDLIFDTMAERLVACEEKSIPGFGKFSIITKNANRFESPDQGKT